MCVVIDMQGIYFELFRLNPKFTQYQTQYLYFNGIWFTISWAKLEFTSDLVFPYTKANPVAHFIFRNDRVSPYSKRLKKKKNREPTDRNSVFSVLNWYNK